MATNDDLSLLCHRCLCPLTPGEGDFYIVRIEAIADPTPPSLSGEITGRELDESINKLVEQMRGMSERDLMDQVYRRLTIHLCGACYREWIEDPTSRP